MALFQTGQTLLKDKNCQAVIAVKDSIVHEMNIPLIQGLLRYAYKLSLEEESARKNTKSNAEGWAFASALLPQFDNCNSVNAEVIKTNMEFQKSNSETAPMKDGLTKLVSSVESMYECDISISGWPLSRNH